MTVIFTATRYSRKCIQVTRAWKLKCKFILSLPKIDPSHQNLKYYLLLPFSISFLNQLFGDSDVIIGESCTRIQLFSIFWFAFLIKFRWIEIFFNLLAKCFNARLESPKLKRFATSQGLARSRNSESYTSNASVHDDSVNRNLMILILNPWPMNILTFKFQYVLWNYEVTLWHKKMKQKLTRRWAMSDSRGHSVSWSWGIIAVVQKCCWWIISHGGP